MMTLKPKRLIARTLALICTFGLAATGWGAATPVAVWDGRHADYNFSSLTRGNFTLGNIGEGYVNSVASDGSYLQIGNQDAKAAITLKKTDSSAMGASTVIIRCENMQTDDGSNRAVLSFMNGTNPYVGIAQQRYLSHASAFIWNNGIWNDNVNVAVENAFSESGDNTIALAHSYANGSAYYVNGVLRCAALGLRASSYNPSGVVIGGVGADGSGSFYAMKGMKITAIAFFNSHISREDIVSYMFPSETAEAYTATVSSSMSWSEIPWDGGKTWGGDTSSAKVNLVINSGATVTAPASLNATKLVVTGAGTLTFAEGENALSVKSAAINAKVDLPSGATLKTAGDVGFYSESNEFRYGSLLEVVSGTACATTYCNSYSGGFAGTITIDPDGTFTPLRTDTLKRDSNKVVINVYGIISFIGNRWTVQGETNHQINLYPGSKVVGAGDGNGVFDFENSGSSIIVHNTNKSGETVSGGVATIDAPMKFRTANANTTINVASGTKLAMKKSLLGNGNIVKTGEGVLEFGVASSRPLTINGGSVVATAMPTGNVTINVDTTFTLKDVAWTSSDIFRGSGTLELLSTTDARTHTVTGSSFAGIVKLSNQNNKQCNLNPTGAATFTAAPELMLSANVVHLGGNYYRQQSGTHGPLEIRDLSGAGTFYAVWSSDAEYEYLVRTKQTKPTQFSGYFYSNTATNGKRRWVNLDVVGDGSGTVNSLTMDHGLWLQTTTDTSEQASTLSISKDAKVVFTSSGTWATGKVVVGEDGWLESANNAAVKNLTLQDGANLVFPADSSKLTGITNITFASGTTEVSFADGVTPTAGTLIDWSGALLESAPAGDFQLVGSVAGDWILTKSASGLSLAEAAAKVTPTTGNPVAYESVALALDDYAKLLDTDEGATMTILDGTILTELDVIQLAQKDIYYDSSSGVLTKAVAKVGQTCYPSLSAAISNGAAVTLLRESSEAITLNKAITLSETANFSGTLTGNGTLTFAKFRNNPSITFDNWTGTVVLPSFTADALNLNNYGKSGSVVEITAVNGGWIVNAGKTIAPTLKLSGNMTIDAMSSWTYTFAEITGSGNLSFSTSANSPTVNITKVAEGYSGTISSTLGNPVTIATLDRAVGTSTAGGTKLLSKSGNVVVSALTVGGVAQQVPLCTADDGIYVACTVTIPKVANATATVTVGGVAATGSSPYTVDVGSDVEITWAPASGYKITAGATQTINAIAADATATAPTVERDTKTFTVVVPENMTVTVDGVPYTANTEITRDIGSTVTIVYKASGAYVGNTQQQFITVGADTPASIATPKDYVAPVPAVAQVGNDYYATLAEAVAAGGEVTLLQNVALTSMIDIDKAVELDLNGKTVSVGEWADTEDALFCVLYGGSLTIKDSTGGTVANPAGEGAIDATGNAAKVYAAVKMTKKGDARDGDEVATLVVEGGTITGSYYAITGNGLRPGTVITINGGVISGTYEGDNLGIYHPQAGTLTLNGGTITGVTGVEMRAGELVVPADSQVVVTATGAFSETASGSGSTVKGAAIALSQHKANPALSANIAGGSFQATGTDAKAFYEVDLQNEVTTGISATVTGGVFAGAVASENVKGFIGNASEVAGPMFSQPVTLDYCATGFIPTSHQQGETTVYGVEAGYVITWDVDGAKTTTTVKAGEKPTMTDPSKANYTFAGWNPTVGAATANATYTATWTANGVTLGTPAVVWGADFTNAVVSATVENGYSDVVYTLTYGQAEVTGTVENGKVTFNVPVAAADRYEDFDYTIAAKVKGSSVGSAKGSKIIADEKNWFVSKATTTTGGAWATTPTVEDDKKMTFSGDNTFTPTAASSGKIVVIDMGNVVFGDTNDAEINDAQAGIRIGANGTFVVLTTGNVWQDTKVAADGEAEYNVVITFNYTTMTYSVKVGDDTISGIALAGNKTKVSSIEFKGAGSLESLTGEYFEGAMVKDNNGATYDTVEDAIAALKAGTATAPLTMLHDGTAPQGWAIEDGKLVEKPEGIVVEEPTTTATEVTSIIAVPQSSKPLTAATLINTESRSEVKETLTLKVYNKKTKDYNSWKYENSKWVDVTVYKATPTETTEVPNTPASSVTLEAGDAVWVTYNPKKPLILNGEYATATVQKTLAAGYNLVAPLPREGEKEINLNSADIFKEPTKAGDRIIIPTSGAPYNCQYRGGKWQTLKVVVDDSGMANVEWVDAPTVKSGTGFWYYSESGSTVDL